MTPPRSSPLTPHTSPPLIPVNEPLLDGNEKRYLIECIETGWISSEGPFVRRLEEEFASRVGRRHGIAVCNGTAALQVAMAALGLGPGDEIVIPTFSIISCAAAVVRAGSTPVVVDCDARTWNLDVDQLEASIARRTRAIMAVHTYGLPADMDPLLAVAERHGLEVIEDAAEAIGQTYRDRPCGSFGALSTFSFYPNKHITTGEGGMIVTDNDLLAERCRGLRNLCFQAGKRFVHDELGWNFRMTNLQAAVGVAQLEQLERNLARKRAIGRRYEEFLAGLPRLILPLPRTEYAENLYWVYGVVLDESVGLDAEAATQRLAALGIGTRPFFWPMHEQPVFRRMGLFEGVSCPVAERIARRGFYLPSGVALTEDQQGRVVDAVTEVVGARR
jgi:perosamine synthetase